MESLSDVDLQSYKYHADSRLKLRWYDRRLRYRNLKNNVNKLEAKEKDYLWRPSVEIANVIGPLGRTDPNDDYITDISLVKEGNESEEEDFSFMQEGTFITLLIH